MTRTPSPHSGRRARSRPGLLPGALLLATLLLPANAPAQPAGLSLDLSEEPAGADAGPIAVVPPHLPNGRVDLAAYRNLLAALAPRYGARLVSEGQTLQVLRSRKLKPVALRAPVGVRWVARQLSAERVIVFTASRREVEIRVFASLGDAPDLEWTAPWRPRLPKAQARALVAELIEKADSALSPPAADPIPERAIAAYSDPRPAPSADAALGDVELEARREAAENAAAPWTRRRPALLVAAGAGAALRNLQVSGGEGLVPIESAAAPGLALYVALYPLQLSEKLADQPWSELLLEGHLRRSLVTATVRGGARDGERASLDDDELLLRLGWRWRFGPGLPGVGLGVGWGSERSAFDAAVPALSTRYQAVSLQLRAQQPLLGTLLGLELVGGPRLLLSGEGAEATGTSWAAEAWLSSRPAGPLFARLGARASSTRLGRADGLEVRDLRTFFALELGAFVQ